MVAMLILTAVVGWALLYRRAFRPESEKQQTNAPPAPAGE